MKFYLVLILAGALLASCADGRRSGKKFMALAGKVKAVKDSRCEAEEKFGEIVAGDVEEVAIHHFNEDGQLVKTGRFGDDGTTEYGTQKFEYEGDVQVKMLLQMPLYGRVVEHTLLDRDDTKRTYEEVVKDEGQVKEKTTLEQTFDSDMTHFLLTAKDEEGNVVRKEETVYDKRGCQLEIKITHGDQMTYWRKSKYDDQCEELERWEQQRERSPETRTYEYRARDAKGNWTEMVELTDGEAGSVTKREITYAE